MEAVGIDIQSEALVRVLVGEPLISVVTDESRATAQDAQVERS